MKQSLNIILLGEPASGKATQSKLLLKKYKLVDLDMGKELRKLQLKSKNHKPLLDKTISVGKLAPTGMVKEIFKDKILSTSNKKGILFDGTPKMLSEAKLVVSLLKKAKRHSPIVIYLSLPASEIYKRASLRKEYVRGKWSKRPDDTKQAIKNRLAYYRTSISAVTKFLKNHYPYKQINGVGSVEDVHLRIAQAIEKMA
jgi:adenylate kinase